MPSLRLLRAPVSSALIFVVVALPASRVCGGATCAVRKDHSLASSSPATPAAVGSVRFPPATVLAPIFFLLGYAVLLFAGFGSGLGTLQALPLYIYFSFLLLVLQWVISGNRSVARVLYIFLTSGFAIVYAGEVLFDPSTGNFTRSSYTYLIINILLLVVFVYDSFDRRRVQRRGLSAALPSTSGASGDAPQRISPLSLGAVATDFAGLAILFYIASFLIDMISHRTVNGHPYINTNLNTLLGLHLNDSIAHLQSLDLVIAFGATAISLLLLGLVGVLTAAAPRAHSQSSATRIFGGSLRTIAESAFNEVLLSLGLVLGPLVWLIPAFSIGNFSKGVVSYLNYSAARSATLLDLFNPVSAATLANRNAGLMELVLGVVAIAAVVLAVVVVEHDGAILQRTIRIYRVAGRSIALTLPFFIYSLAAVNAFAVLVSATKAEPFQVGAPGLVALVAGGIFVAVTAVRARMPAKVLTPVG